MAKEEVLKIAQYTAIMVVLGFCTWGAVKFLADSISDYEVITPKQGVECVVVSRMFNTSVDCWKEL